MHCILIMHVFEHKKIVRSFLILSDNTFRKIFYDTLTKPIVGGVRYVYAVRSVGQRHYHMISVSVA